MTNLTICSVAELDKVIQRTAPEAIISITDPDEAGNPTDALPNYEGSVLRLGFHDLERVERGYISPSLRDADKVQMYLNAEFKDAPKSLVVHCHMGVSRSTATAIFAMAVLKTRLNQASPELGREIVNEVFEAAPWARPNTRIIKMISKRMPGFGHSIERAVREKVAASDHEVNKQPFSW